MITVLYSLEAIKKSLNIYSTEVRLCQTFLTYWVESRDRILAYGGSTATDKYKGQSSRLVGRTPNSILIAAPTTKLHPSYRLYVCKVGERTKSKTFLKHLYNHCFTSALLLAPLSEVNNKTNSSDRYALHQLFSTCWSPTFSGSKDPFAGVAWAHLKTHIYITIHNSTKIAVVKNNEIILWLGSPQYIVKGGSLRKAKNHCSEAGFLQRLVLDVYCEYHFNLHINLLNILQAKKVINCTREINIFPPKAHSPTEDLGWVTSSQALISHLASARMRQRAFILAESL